VFWRNPRTALMRAVRDGHPLIAYPMQREELLLDDRSGHWHDPPVRTASRSASASVRSVLFRWTYGRTILGRQKTHAMPVRLRDPRPEMRRPTRFHDTCAGGWSRSTVRIAAASSGAAPRPATGHSRPRLRRHSLPGPRNRRSIHVGLLLVQLMGVSCCGRLFAAEPGGVHTIRCSHPVRNIDKEHIMKHAIVAAIIIASAALGARTANAKETVSRGHLTFTVEPSATARPRPERYNLSPARSTGRTAIRSSSRVGSRG